MVFLPGRGTLDQLCTLARVLEGEWELVHMSIGYCVWGTLGVWSNASVAPGYPVPVEMDQEFGPHCW